MNQRINTSDVIIYLKFPVYKCYFYALVRHIKYSVRQNPYDLDNSPMIFKTRRMLIAMRKVYREYEPDSVLILRDFGRKKILIYQNRKEVNDFIGIFDNEGITEKVLAQKL